jgi:ferredoxin--NADP+ reductase
MKVVSIIQNVEIAPEIYLLSFERFFDFIPGQVIHLTADNSVAPRMYSIASGNKEEKIQVLYDVKPEGQLTNMLRNLKAGDRIKVSQPFGNFTCADGKGMWIATGTGIAPFYSMVKSDIPQSVELLHGVRKPEGLLFKEEFLMGNNLKYHPCVSGTPTKGAFHGRVTEFLHHSELDTTIKYYLCGSTEIVVDVRDLLIARGVSFGNIFSEIYF